MTARHLLWSLVHNLIVHPLLALADVLEYVGLHRVAARLDALHDLHASAHPAPVETLHEIALLVDDPPDATLGTPAPLAFDPADPVAQRRLVTVYNARGEVVGVYPATLPDVRPTDPTRGDP